MMNERWILIQNPVTIGQSYTGSEMVAARGKFLPTLLLNSEIVA